VVSVLKYKVKAAVLPSFKSKFDVKEVELEAPDDWVLVNIKYVGICGRDVVVWKGGFKNLKTPLILGHEIFGYYEDKPVGVFPGILSEDCRKEDVICEKYMILGEQVPGGYADKVAIPTWNLVPLPDNDLIKYAAATCGVATLIHVAKVLSIRSGEKVLVTGASGGVGIHGIQYLSLIGAEVYAYTRSKEKAEILKRIPDINVITDLSFYKKIGRMDHVIELVGAPTLNQSMRSLRLGGSLALVGNITGEPITIERPALFVMRELKMTGSAAYTKKEYETAIKLIGRDLIKPFYKIYKLEDINTAYKDVLESKVIGRAILKI
jgi:D-arabinose 1-dehydrogenase-like Zn-dependent alcohol dehydrogenase